MVVIKPNLLMMTIVALIFFEYVGNYTYILSYIIRNYTYILNYCINISFKKYF